MKAQVGAQYFILGPIRIDNCADIIIGADLTLDVCHLQVPVLVEVNTVSSSLHQGTIGVDVIFDKSSPPGGIALASDHLL